MLIRIVSIVGLLFGSSLYAQEDELFEITRNKDEHKIIYYLNQDKIGNLDLKEPIGAYWRRMDESGRTSRSLNMLERKYAYGMKFLETKSEFARFRFVSYDKREFILKRILRDGFAVFTDIDGKELKIQNIHLHLDGGTFWFPKITSIELRGHDQFGEDVIKVIQEPWKSAFWPL